MSPKRESFRVVGSFRPSLADQVPTPQTRRTAAAEIDTTREENAVNEARRLGIPTVAIVDTNADPEIIDYPIPGNDDAIRAIRVMLQKLVDAIVSASGEARMREEVEMAGVSA